MIGFALSGGGNRGAIQAGGLIALFEHGLTPELIVGTSAGAYNGAYIAAQPGLDGAHRLADLWRQTRGDELLPGNLLTKVFRFVTGQDSLTNSDGLRRFVQRVKPAGVETFRDLQCKLYLATADLGTGTLYVYGDDPDANLVEALLASSALPGLFPPVVIEGQQFVDGAVVANVPISLAIDRGATTIYALSLYNGGPRPPAHGVIDIIRRSVDVAVYQQLVYDLRRVREDPQVTVHYVYMGDLFDGVGLEDFTQIDLMIDAGYRRTRDYLSHPSPLDVSLVAPAVSHAPPGARPYVPRS